MSESLRGIRIAVDLDTNKATYREAFGEVDAFVQWWNEHAEALGLPLLTLPPA